MQNKKKKKKNFQELHLFLFSGPAFGTYEKGISLNRVN
jgi:hypothetical protein